MAVFGSVIFSRVVTQYYTGAPIIPSGDDIFLITADDFEIYGDGVEITFNQLQEYCPRTLTIECSNNTEIGVATINIIDPNPDGQFSTSGTFEIIHAPLIDLPALRYFKTKLDASINASIDASHTELKADIAETYATKEEVTTLIGDVNTTLENILGV